ncbi:ABC transporter permease subunit [Pectinatus haikarae]|uniref:ABC transporter permease subunit n=1 Tax=Pectinatus haikarae TaxID=349096 RepID=UPI0018C4DDE6|nr:ABC transporter permease subunit [Pectinatus haikarae]
MSLADSQVKIKRNFPCKPKIWLTTEHLITLSTVAVIFISWYAATEWKLFSEVIIPPPGKVYKTFIDILSEGYKGAALSTHLFDSIERLLAAFVFVCLTAVPAGLLSGYNSKIRAVLEPLVGFYRPLPPLAYYTMLVIWMGIGNSSKIMLLYLAGFAPVYLACISGVMKIKRDYISGAYTLGANKYQVFVYVVLPACLPDIFTGLRTALGFSYTTLVAAEMVAAETGIGWMVLDASKFLLSDVIFVGIFIMGITGIMLDVLLKFMENKIIPWKGKE